LSNSNQFTAISPGGNTKCFHGTDYAFMVRKGTINKLVFEFEGGGACWSELTCGLGSCTQTVDPQGEVSMLNGKNSGMHDGDNDKNPFKEWYHVYIPYCTCDIHTGVNDHKYGAKTVYHRGHINFMTVLNWTLANFPTNPTDVTISGCSAGGAAAQLNWPFIANVYPAAKHYVWADSFVGVMSKSQYDDGYKNWGMTYDVEHVPALAPQYTSTLRTNMACYLNEVMLNVYPKTEVALYTSNSDDVQASFYRLGGGLSSWSELMREDTTCMQHNTTQVHSFIASGSDHCRSQDDGFFSVTTDGTNLAEWVGKVVTGQAANRLVDCAADSECKAAEADSFRSLDNYSSSIPYRH